jgi:hypothetical protein
VRALENIQVKHLKGAIEQTNGNVRSDDAMTKVDRPEAQGPLMDNTANAVRGVPDFIKHRSLHIVFASTSGHTLYVVDTLIDSLKGIVPAWEIEETMAEKTQPQDLLRGDVLVLASATWNTGSIICPITDLWPGGLPVIGPESMTSAKSVPADLVVLIRSGYLPVSRQSQNLVCIPEHKRVQRGKAWRLSEPTTNTVASFQPKQPTRG